MTTSQEVEQYADKFGDSYPATVVYLRQYAALIKTYADDGMVRVPVEPNEGMMMAILNRGLGDPPDPAWIKVAKSRWAYLLEAAKGVTQLKGNRNEPGADV